MRSLEPERRAFETEWRDREQDPGTFLAPPPMIGIIAEKRMGAAVSNRRTPVDHGGMGNWKSPLLGLQKTQRVHQDDEQHGNGAQRVQILQPAHSCRDSAFSVQFRRHFHFETPAQYVVRPPLTSKTAPVL